MRRPLHGVDFSGARRAGHDVWIAEASVTDDEVAIDACTSAADRFGVADRGPCLAQLGAFLREAHVVGLDFPFGVPKQLHDRDTWADHLEWVATVATDAEGFETTCRQRAEAATDGERTYLLRETDGPVGAQSPYSKHVHKQTFYGIRDVLASLAPTPDVAVRPMQDGGGADATDLCEVYPAAALAALDLPAEAYADSDGRARERRRAIVEGLEAETPVTIADEVRGTLLEDAGGHAIDSVVAALSTWRALQADFEPDRPWEPVEGHIYV